jgi:hypothetical protein
VVRFEYLKQSEIKRGVLRVVAPLGGLALALFVGSGYVSCALLMAEARAITATRILRWVDADAR